MKPIVSVRDLAWRLGIPIERLRQVADNVKAHYRPQPLRDKNNKHKVRILTVPSPELKDIQRRITNRILSNIPLGNAVHGGIRGRSPSTNASQHLHQRYVVNLDVKSFFPSVRHYMVYRMFRREFDFGADVARLLTRLTTFNAQLPQGAPTSMAVANALLALPVDKPMDIQGQQLGVRYSRFVDDITLSGDNPTPLISVVGQMLSKRRLPMYRKKSRWYTAAKLKITPRSQQQEVTGLLVNSRGGPSISRQRRDEIRAAIIALRGANRGAALNAAVRSIRGRIAHVRQFNSGAAARLERCLDSSLA